MFGYSYVTRPQPRTMLHECALTFYPGSHRCRTPNHGHPDVHAWICVCITPVIEYHSRGSQTGYRCFWYRSVQPGRCEIGDWDKLNKTTYSNHYLHSGWPGNWLAVHPGNLRGLCIKKLKLSRFSVERVLEVFGRSVISWLPTWQKGFFFGTSNRSLWLRSFTLNSMER